jgi:hypothetical protein
VLASSAPQGTTGTHGWAPEVIGAIGAPQTSPEAYLDVFFTRAGTQRQRPEHRPAWKASPSRPLWPGLLRMP